MNVIFRMNVELGSVNTYLTMGGQLLLMVASISCFIRLVYLLPLRETRIDMIEHRGTGNVRFFLYTHENANEAHELFVGDKNSVKNSSFNKSFQTKILIHGWGGSYLTSPNPSIRQAYFAQQNCNVISVDWSAYSKLNYVSARAKVPVAGEDVAEFIDFLHSEFNLNFDMVVVIGHSLGAHVAGFCGKSVKLGTLAGIVGLDPASPLYNYENSETRLASTDANYVQTLQTNGNLNGFLNPIGAASFYPNWGRKQPGCGIDINGSCSHGRSVTLYTESIRGYSFAPISECDSFEDISTKSGCSIFREEIQFGDPLQIHRKEGIFYVETNGVAPFGHLTERNIPDLTV